MAAKTKQTGTKDDGSLEVLGSGSEVASPAPKLDTKDRIDLIKIEVEKGKNEEEKERILFKALGNFLSPDEQEVLGKLESLEEPTEDVKDYLLYGTAMLSAVYQGQKDKPATSIRELIDHFSEDPSQSTQTLRKALLFVLNHPSSKVSSWFTGEAWKLVPGEAHKFLLASEVAGEELDGKEAEEKKDKKDQSFLDKLKDGSSEYSDEIKLAAIVGGIGLGIYAISKWLNKDKAPGEQPSGVGTALKYGAYALGGAFVYGKILGSDWVQDQFSKDNDSFVNSRFSKAAIAFGNFEWGNCLRLLFGEATTMEQTKQFEMLSELFEVEDDRLLSISRLNFVDFMDGKASTLLNLDTQREGDEKVRSRIKDYYFEQIKLIPNYETMTVGQIFEIGLRQGIFVSKDTSDLNPEDQEDLAAQKAKDEQSLAELSAAFDKPEENMDAFKGASKDLLTDIEELTDFEEDWWKEAAGMADRALFFNMFTDADDTHEYGDIKAMREYILSTSKKGLAEEKKVLAKMGVDVQDFQDFLEEHPNPSEWTQADKDKFALYKTRILAMRQQLDSARRQVNEQRMRDLEEDYKEITKDDLLEGGVLALHGLFGILTLGKLEIQSVYNGDLLTWSLLVTQVGGAGYQVMKDSPKGFKGYSWSVTKGFVKGPVQVVQLGLDFIHAKEGLEYSSKELLKRYFRGELSKAEVETRLEYAKKYSYLIERGPVGSARNFKAGKTLMHPLVEKVRKLLELEGQLKYFSAWDDHFAKGAALSEGADEFSALRAHLDEAERAEIRSFYKAGGGASVEARRAAAISQRVQLDELTDGKVSIKVDGKVVNIAKTEEEAFKMADDLIAEAEKGGKKLDKMKLKNLWKFAGPAVQLLGTAFTINLFYKIQTADSEETLRKVVVEETANILAFLAGSKLTMEFLLKIKKPGDPKLAAVYAVLSIIGGMATALGLDEPIVYMLERFLDKYPNSYEVSREAGALLESASLLMTVRMNQALVTKAGEKILKTETGKAAQKLSREAAEALGKRMTVLAEKNFTKKLLKACGADALKMLFKKAGWKGAVGGGLFFVDGPIPVGDAIGALFLAWTAKDVYDLGTLVYEGYKLNEELNKRLPLPVLRFEVKEPASLLAKYNQVDQSNAAEVFEEILKEPNAVVRIQREGDAGYEMWTVENGEIANLTLFDMQGERIAGLNDEDLQKVVEAQEMVEAAPEAGEKAA